ncbi:hypothetical protein ACFPYK_05600 [Mumia xiangluensis]|uniref:Uncharacterized protein n=1 Tax=Mumia xiangluensis TaxID=1678900 RepID=A0ABW1QKN0_9ACTN
MAGLLGAGLPLASAAPAAAEDTGGVFVPVTPKRIVDANTWGPASTGNFNANETRSYQVTDVGEVPASGVSAVVIDLAAHGTTAATSSYMTAWASGTPRPVVSNLYYDNVNVPRSNTAIVPVGDDGKFSLYNYIGTTSVTVDIQGYFTTGGAVGGGFEAITPTRIANTAGSAGAGPNVPQQRLATDASVDIQVAGLGDIPTDATAVFANIEARNATAPGQLKVGPGGASMTSSYPAAMDYGTSGPYDSGVNIKLNADGKLRVTNYKGSSVDVKVDVQGYFTGTAGEGSVFHPMNPANIYATGTTDPAAQLQAGETRLVQVEGVAGIPSDGSVTAIPMTVSVKAWTASGTVTVFNADDEMPGTTTSSFTKDLGDPWNGITSTAIVGVSGDGQVAVHNTSTQPVVVTLTGQGWFADPRLADVEPEPAPEGTAHVSGTVIESDTPAAGAEVAAGIWPNADYLANAPADVDLPIWRVPATTTNDAGDFEIDVDTSQVPAEFVNPDGSVDLQILAEDEGLGAPTFTPAPVIAEETSEVASFSTVDDDEAAEPPHLRMDLSTGSTTNTNDPESEWETDVEPAEVVSLQTTSEMIDAPTSPLSVTAEDLFPSEWTSETVAESNARTAAMLNGTESVSPGAASARAGGVPCISNQPTGEVRNGVQERFGSIYNWSGAPVSWTQRTGATHTLGVAASYDGGSYRPSGTISLSRTKSSGGSVTKKGQVNRTWWNKVNYRQFRTGCAGTMTTYWRPSSWNMFFTKSEPSVKKNWREQCTAMDPGDTFEKTRGKSYTKSSAISLAGVSLSAQAGYTRATKLLFNFKKKSIICANSSVGPLTSRAVQAHPR